MGEEGEGGRVKEERDEEEKVEKLSCDVDKQGEEYQSKKRQEEKPGERLERRWGRK